MSRICKSVTANSRTLASTFALAALACCAGWQVRATEADDGGQPIDFNKHVRPILSDKCFHCHGPDSAAREADLRLDREESALADRGGYAAVVPGDPAVSELMRRVTSSDEHERMPPPEMGKPLDADEIEILRQWITAGAPWSPAWAYLPPKWTDAPQVDGATRAGWIDRFLLARLEKEGVEASPEAERVTLIRRLSFDLVGLPPTPAEVDAFVEDRSEEAYDRLVDRLLDSPHFGERMASYWLDLVRFADTVGYHGDQPHAIWPYRDYVIHAFNSNMPFDRFTSEQLAGDLLAAADTDTLIASGYNRLLQTSHEGGVQLKEYRAIYLADRVRNVSQVWMGATMGCAQCHDHKFDPISTRDFYALGAFFADIDDEDHLRQPSGRDFNRLPSPRFPEKEVLSYYQREKLAALGQQIAGVDPDVNPRRHKQLAQQIEELRKSKAITMVSTSGEPRTVRVLPRGNWLDESGEIVLPAVPKFLASEQPATSRRLTRLDLARWLTDAEEGVGGLTARVMVNRFWYLMFGRGIAPVLDDFGGQGQPPEHPELLDNLAIEFVRSGWDVKHIFRLIARSDAYRQSSVGSKALAERDPYNALVARQSRHRVPAESVRDAALKVSGLLDEEIGGPSVKPYQPAGYYRHLNFPKRKYKHHRDSRQWRRGLYVHWQRQFLHPMLRAFDAPSREECTARRPRSNTSLAALTLLNDTTFVEAARAFAERVLASSSETTSDRARLAFRWTVSRLPTDEELSLLEKVYQRNRKYYQQHQDRARELLSNGQYRTSESLDPVELAAWTGVTRTLLNLGETYTRN